MKIPVKSVLFKRITDINWRAMTGRERGQYDLRLGTDTAFEKFFDVTPLEEPTDLGGWSRRVTLQPYEGANSVAGHTVTFRYMGPASSRKDYYFASQKFDLPESYPLWRPGRVAPVDAPFASIEGATAVVVRDANDRFHARWVSADGIQRLPKALRSRIAADGKGVYEVAEGSAPVSKAAQAVVDALLKYHNVLLYGPPATGKTYIVQEVQRAFGLLTIDTENESDPLSDSSSSQTLWTTFHQSYSYEDFIVGLRPRPRDDGGFSLEAVAGTLLELSEWARTPGRRSLLIIDEINRGNVSRIFGELITLLEVDKRLSGDGSPLPTTVSVRLPYVSPSEPVHVTLPDGSDAEVPQPYTLPRDVYVLATMNSVDTSVAPLDAALRRRFTMVPLVPDLVAMAESLGLSDPAADPDPGLKTRNDVSSLGLRVLERVNDGIAMFLGADFQLGHWYLRPLAHATTRAAAVDALVDVWTNSILPQLIEYFAGRTAQLVAVLGEPAGSKALEIADPNAEWEFLGASSFVRVASHANAEDVLELLRCVARVAPDSTAE